MKPDRWVAAAIGPLKMSLEETFNELQTLADTVFINNNEQKIQEEFDITRLRESIEDLIQRKGRSKDIKMSEFQDLKCKV